VATAVPITAQAEIALYTQRIEQLYSLVERAALKAQTPIKAVRSSPVQINSELMVRTGIMGGRSFLMTCSKVGPRTPVAWRANR